MLDKKKIAVLIVGIVLLIGAFMFANYVNPESMESVGNSIPLPVFTFLVAIIDGFNPCNLFVLTLLMSLMLAESHSRKKIYAVGYTFIAVIYIFYYIFTAIWVNGIYQFLGYIPFFRLLIAAIAIIAGLINCKELFFYRKGITLMIQDRYTVPLKKKVQKLVELSKVASLPTLMFSAATLAIFASLVELPCTAGFPAVYGGILRATVSSQPLVLAYLALYNLFYVTPLIVLITIMGYTFKGKQIDKTTMSYIKFIGGIIMLILGIILLVNPALLGMAA